MVGLVSAAGTQTKTYDYDAFGNEKDRLGSDPNPFRYCGEYFDAQIGNKLDYIFGNATGSLHNIQRSIALLK